MGSMLPLIIGLLLAAMMGLAIFALSRRFGDSLWGWLPRKAGADVSYLHATFERMFMPVSFDRCRLIVWGSAAFGALVGITLTWSINWFGTILFTVIFAWVAFKLPPRVVKFMHKRYVNRFDDQLVDALTMAASALRSGLSLPQALDLVSQEMPKPINQEIALTLKEQKMGKTLDESLEALIARVPSDDLNIAVNAVLVLRETGGNLSETFDTIVYTISERNKVKGKIRTLTAQGVGQGIILICMPFVLAYVLHVLNPDYMRPLFTTLVGWIFLGFMVLMLFVGGLLIRKIVTIDV